MSKYFKIALKIYQYLLFTLITVSLVIISINLVNLTKCIVSSDKPYIRVGGDIETSVDGKVNARVTGSLSADVYGDINASHY